MCRNTKLLSSTVIKYTTSVSFWHVIFDLRYHKDFVINSMQELIVLVCHNCSLGCLTMSQQKDNHNKLMLLVLLVGIMGWIVYCPVISHLLGFDDMTGSAKNI